MTITLTPELEEALAKEAKRLGKTPEELAEETLRARLGPQITTDEYPPGTTLADLFAGKIGLIDSSKANGGQPSHLAENSKEGFGKIITEKHVKRAARQ